MVLVRTTPYFPNVAHSIMRAYPQSTSEAWRALWPSGTPVGGASRRAPGQHCFLRRQRRHELHTAAFDHSRANADCARRPRAPYAVEMSFEMAKAIANSSLCRVPNAGRGPVIGQAWTEFVRTASRFLKG